MKIFPKMKRKVSLMLVLLAGTALTVLSCALVPSGSTGTTGQVDSVARAGGYNYGEALQKAVVFYEFQRSGAIPAGSRNNWRTNSGMKDGSDNGLDLTGGWYDAGDHVKFNLPMAYTVSMLCWGIYEYGSAITASGQMSYLLDNIKWASDYLIKCHPSVSVFYYQVGDGGLDHAWWGPAEVMQMARPSYKVTTTAPGSTVSGEAAAALAATAYVFKTSNPTYAATCLQHAKDLYTFAETTKSDSGYTAALGYYNSWSGFYDELVWAGVWIYLASGDSTYLTKAETYFANIGMEGQTTNVAYKWTQSWDDVHYGAELLLAKITGNVKYKTAIENNLDYWTTGGPDGTKITYTPKGLAWLDSWGCLRYASTAAFMAFVYSGWSGANTTKAATYKAFAENQINYALGSTGRSFEIGFGVNPPVHPHHRTSHSSWADSQTVPLYHRHTLYGALVGGPNSSDGYTDSISDYTMNEVACDYNAGLVCSLAKMYSTYGGTPIANFQAVETPSNVEYFVQTYQNSISYNLLEVKFLLNNLSGWPAQACSNTLSYRYFIDITELVARGYTANNITVTVNYNQDSGGAVSLKQWSGNIYYINVNWTGLIYPGGQSAYKKEIQVRFAYPTGVTNDNSNDWSYQYFNNVVTLGTTNNPNVPVYMSGVKKYGNEPGVVSSSSVSSVQSSAVSSAASSAVSSAVSSISSSKSSVASSAISSTVSSAVSSSKSSVASSAVSSAVSSAASSAVSSAAGGLKVQFYNGNLSSTVNMLYQRFKLVNTGTTAVSLSTVKMRYYYTIDGEKAQNFWCDWSTAGSANVTGTFVKMTTVKTNADYYLEVGFTTAAGNINPGAAVEVQTRVAKTDWSNYLQTNDYSFNPTSTSYIDWTKVTAYISGVLKWGVEP